MYSRNRNRSVGDIEGAEVTRQRGKRNNDFGSSSDRYINIDYGWSVRKIFPRGPAVKWFSKKDSDG
jgi:hypothetical protein